MFPSAPNFLSKRPPYFGSFVNLFFFQLRHLNSLLKLLRFTYYICALPAHTYICLGNAWCLWSSAEGIRFHRTEVINGCELLCGAENWTQVLCKRKECCYPQPVSLQPLHFIFRWSHPSCEQRPWEQNPGTLWLVLSPVPTSLTFEPLGLS